MKTYTTIYRTKKQLSDFIAKSKIMDAENVLIQVFTKEGQLRMNRLHSLLSQTLPRAVIIGATVEASIHKEIKKAGTVVSFTIFEKTKLRSTSIPLSRSQNAYDCGLEIGSRLVDEETKAIVLFGSSHTFDNRSVLDALEVHCPDVYVAGGNAVPAGEKKAEFLISNEGLMEIGVVAVSLSGKELFASLHACTEWRTAGRSFAVTEADGNSIRTLNDRPVKAIYEHYLGKDMIEQIERADSTFPLMVRQGGVTKPILFEGFHEDGSITVFDPIEVGSTVYIGCGDASLFLNTFTFISDSLRKVPVEGVFMYSCLSRLRFFKKGIEHEMNTFKNLIPTTGAFTAGEYYHEEGKNNILSYALTFLALAEKEVYIDESDIQRATSAHSEIKEILALSQLIKASTDDLEELYSNLKESEQRYKSLFEHNPDIVYSTDIHGKITSINSTTEKILGYTNDEVAGKNALEFIDEQDRERVRHYFHLAMQNQPQHFTTVIRKKNGENILFEVANMPIQVNDEIVGIYGVAKNRTEQILAEQKITQLAYNDSLTGLPNRMYFNEQLEGILQESNAIDQKVAVMVVDLDEFKLINDSLGHEAGDRILKHVAKNMNGMLSDRQFLARFAADEFLVMVPYPEEIEQVMTLAKNLLSVIKKPVFIKGKEYVLSGSIGISVFPDDAMDAEQLLKNANLAMHQAKLVGRNSVQLFTADMYDQINERLELENHLRKALELNELEIYYQPQIDIKTGEVFAFEALMRWKHTKRGMIPPNIFIPIAEYTGMINEIGKWGLEKACRQIRSWHDEGMEGVSICVNVSGKQFQRVDFIHEVKECLKKTGLEPAFLHIELTESIMLEDVDHTLWVINQLRALGVKISVDDFGTGYSSLSYLRDFPIDILKIDQSFIRNLDEYNSDAAIVRAIITMCEGLNVTVLAEGVETKDQLKTLKKFGCNQVQGYYISKPVEATEILSLNRRYSIV